MEVTEKPVIETSDEALAAVFWQITENAGIGRRAAITRVAREHGRTAREVYLAVEKHKKSAT
jgi:hypothetical protein